MTNLLNSIEFRYGVDYILVKVMPSEYDSNDKYWRDSRYITDDYCVMKNAAFDIDGNTLNVSGFLLRVLALDKNKRYAVTFDQSDPHNKVVMKCSISEAKGE